VGLGVLAISPDALIIRLVKMPPASIAFWRGLFMSLGFVLMALVLYRGSAVRRFQTMGRVGLAVAGFGACTNLLFVTAITHTAVSNTLVILAASPVFAAVLSALFLGDRIPPVTWAASLLILGGVAVIVHSGLAAGAGAWGDAAALAGSLCTAGMLVVLRRHPGADPVPGLALGGLLAAVIVSPSVDGFAPSAHDLALLILLGVVLLPIAIGLITRGPRYLPAPEVGLVTLLETLLGPLWVWLVIGGAPSRASIFSGVLIVAVLAVHSTIVMRAQVEVA
jgi:drug/metabolite transporter (DMT)-like permease